MTVSGVSSSVSAYQTSQSSSSTRMDQLFDNLGAALKSGNLSDAREAFAQLQKSAPAKSGTGTTGTNPISSEIESLSKALDSGDLKAAKEAYTQIQSKLSQGGQTEQQAGKPAGGQGGAKGGSVSVTSSQSSGKVYDKMDANEDGKVTAAEEYTYKLKHPEEEKKTQNLLQGSGDSTSSVGTIIDTMA
ncbi:MAG: hypothetical protein AB9866_24170 [Syntrophobacteraceae bacterium]